MGDHYKFEIVCPNNHNQTIKLSEQEFNDAQKTGGLLFHCNTCDTDWPPSHEDIVKFRKQFSSEKS